MRNARARQSTSRSSADKAQELEAAVAHGMQPAASFKRDDALPKSCAPLQGLSRGASNAVAEPHVATSLESLGLVNGDLRSQPRDTQSRNRDSQD